MYTTVHKQAQYNKSVIPMVFSDQGVRLPDYTIAEYVLLRASARPRSVTCRRSSCEGCLYLARPGTGPHRPARNKPRRRHCTVRHCRVASGAARNAPRPVTSSSARFRGHLERICDAGGQCILHRACSLENNETETVRLHVFECGERVRLRFCSDKLFISA